MNNFRLCNIQHNTHPETGLPAGGYARGVGLSVDWQDGPLGRDGDRIEPNGAFVETLIQVCADRIMWYQDVCGGRFWCGENERAITHLLGALEVLKQRTSRREAAKIEGTHAEDSAIEKTAQ